MKYYDIRWEHISWVITLSSLLHEEPSPAQGGKCDDDETGQSRRTTVRVIPTELLELLASVHHNVFILG